MTEWIRELVETLGFWSLPILTGAAVIEYLLPPFPGDTVTLFGAVLSVRGHIHWALVWLAVTAGTAVGVPIDWWIGRWLGAHSDRLPPQAYKPWWHPLSRERVHRIERRYRRWGSWFILLNRFVPAARSVFFLAAGASEIPLWRSLLLGLVSAGAWNALLIGAGYVVGENLDELDRQLHRYNAIAWTVLAVVVAVSSLVWLVRRLRPRHPEG